MCGKIERLCCLLLGAATLIAVDNIASANADQVTGQELLLVPFNLLRDTTAGLAFLNANLNTENAIYLNSTQAEKIAAGTVLIPQFISANVLLRAFPDNPNFGYTPTGLPSAPPSPASVANAVNDILNNQQITALKPYFGNVNIYGKTYGLVRGQTDTLGNPPPYQVSSAILLNPFTPANSSLLAYQNQQTPGAFGVNWSLGNSGIADFPSGHTLISTIMAQTYEVLAPGFYQQIAQGQAQFAYDLNVYAAHYPSDVIGGRILGLYVVAQTLSGNPLYPPRKCRTGEHRRVEPGDAGLPRRRRQLALCCGLRRKCRRMRRAWRYTLCGKLCPTEPGLCGLPDLWPATRWQHRCPAGRAARSVSADRGTVSLFEHRATQ